MANKYKQDFPIPQDFETIITDFAREVLRDQPEDIIKYAYNFFECKRQGLEYVYQSKYNVRKQDKQVNRQYYKVLQANSKRHQQSNQSFDQNNSQNEISQIHQKSGFQHGLHQDSSFELHSLQEQSSNVTERYMANYYVDQMANNCAQVENSHIDPKNFNLRTPSIYSQNQTEHDIAVNFIQNVTQQQVQNNILIKDNSELDIYNNSQDSDQIINKKKSKSQKNVSTEQNKKVDKQVNEYLQDLTRTSLTNFEANKMKKQILEEEIQQNDQQVGLLQIIILQGHHIPQNKSIYVQMSINEILVQTPLFPQGEQNPKVEFKNELPVIIQNDQIKNTDINIQIIESANKNVLGSKNIPIDDYISDSGIWVINELDIQLERGSHIQLHTQIRYLNKDQYNQYQFENIQDKDNEVTINKNYF